MKIYTRDKECLYLYVEGDFHELEFIDRALTFVDEKKERDYQMALKSKAFYVTKPEPIKFFDRENSRFLSGMLPYLSSQLIEIGGASAVQFEIDEELPNKPIKDLYSFEYRDYQRNSIEAALNSKRGIIKVATAGGKTSLAGGIIKSLDQPSLFLVTQVPLLHQAVNSFRNFGIRDIGVIGDRRKEPGYHTIADARYLSQLIKKDKNIRKFVKQVRVLITDEVHRSAANSWLTSIIACEHIERIFGLSGTPFESRMKETIRDLQIKGIFGDVIYEVTARELMEQGYIAKPKIYMLSVTGGALKHGPITNFRNRGRQYNRIYTDGIVKHKERNNKAIDALYMLSKINDFSTLVLVNQIKHGTYIIDALHALGIPSVFLAGNKAVWKPGLSEPEQDVIIDFKSETVADFADGKYKVLVGSPVLGEGYDLPGDMVEAMVVLSGGKGLIPVLQRLGRALRPKSGSNEVVVIDFHDYQHFYLENHSRRREAEYKSEGYEVFGEEEFINEFMKIGDENGEEGTA